MPAPRPRKPAPPADAPRREIVTLRARLADAERRAREADDHCNQAVHELDVYKEEVRQQTDELITAAHAVEYSRDRYAALYEFAPIPYLTLDRSGVIEELNISAATLLGADRARALKMPFLSFVAGADRQAYMKHLLRCRRHGGQVSTELHVLPRGAAEPLHVLVSTWAGPGRTAAAAANGARGADNAARHNSPDPHNSTDRRDGRYFRGAGSDDSGAPGELRTALLDLTDRRRAQQQEAHYQHRLRSLAAELSLAEERERRRIAVEIHDQISQSLAMAKMKLDVLGSKVTAAEQKKAVKEVSTVVEEVLGHTRSLTFELSPPVLHELGFEPAIEWLAERTAEQYPLRVEVDAPRQPTGIPHDLAVLLFQAARELLVNVVKHAGATRAVVRLRRHGGSVRLVVEDDGRGFAAGNARPDPRSDGRGGGFGLFSIRTRLEHYGGSFSAEGMSDGGSRVTLMVPFDPAGDGAATPAAGQPGGAREKERVDRSGPPGNNGPSAARPVAPPDRPAEGAHDESATRRRPPHRSRRAPKPPRKPA